MFLFFDDWRFYVFTVTLRLNSIQHNVLRFFFLNSRDNFVVILFDIISISFVFKFNL